ncbi:hypothetical protein Dacet_1070 [Denitrovibrio acetiphilus DSM 12809]|uniref:Uncharacterized protein n=1 Tax=Denitrovibrio acetiphilus (strain DSM 12809 / NBRC 114555 / N2460) TaxID=522772 RepID=D4H6X9_DENA2|nr:hypothetical protein [Denitrovibrio acetiphilus]ADD67845.1 hypothetical protein Dacet_1070 [Denitrovibrio acetiphilus DSM 12809]
MRKNLRFNRNEYRNKHQYLDDFTKIRSFDRNSYEGFIKCKLIHGKSYSIIVPDQIYVDINGNLYWLQPFYFVASFISFYDAHELCTLNIDISYGANIEVKFNNTDKLNNLEDGSVLYKCTIHGPEYIYNYRTGYAKIVDDIPYIELFHHTSVKAKKSILSSGSFNTSDWNIQGTKKALNISYLYLTPLPIIKYSADLQQIAMSSIGKFPLRLDGNYTTNPDLLLDVYRESTVNRKSTLSFWVNASYISSQPIYFHTANSVSPAYYEIVAPFIHRIGVEKSTLVLIENGELLPVKPKSTTYVIIGDASTISGLQAPFAEDDISDLAKIEYVFSGEEIIDFWKSHSNTDQYSVKDIEKIEY